MVDVSSQSNKVNITVSSSGTSSNVNASGDTAMYYSNKSKEYAISDRLIDGKYRSSKYYSEQAQQSAIQAEGAKELVLEAKDGVVAEVIQEGENQRESLQAETQNQILVLQEVSEEEQETITEIKESIGQGKAVYLGENEPTDDIYSVWVSPEDDEVTLMIKDIEEKLEKISGAYVGQTIFSLDPLNEDGLHLLDGSLLQADGIYASFVNDYISNLYITHPNRFCTEEEWQNYVLTYGVCGKYVYTEGVSVRLPKATGIVEGTLDVNALGEITEAGLPNITGHIVPLTSSNYPTDGAFELTGNYSAGNAYTGANAYKETLFDASKSNPIYGNSDTVQPQTIKGYYYIVVATGTKTSADVEIDNIVTDLNGKADADLNNINASQSAKNEIARWLTPNWEQAIDITASVNNYTAPSIGWIVGSYESNADEYWYINGVVVGFNDSGSQAGHDSFLYFYVNKGDVLSYEGSSSGNKQAVSFVPIRGIRL